ncbi:MAG TPA: serine/threonine-protein kinase [Terriglobales bacterium]|nr:serine/threonine-protein kinase [Terriglobales bacterium]
MSTKIGRFEVLSELSKSANGAVYKANDPGASRTVVLKTLKIDLPPDLAKILIQIILHEAESSKVLNSQNIALLYGAGEIDGQFCAAMEYVEGNSLSAMIARQEGFSIWDLLDIGRQVCNALDHADTRGVVHRSLEPEKIMMQWDGTVKLLGYGVSTMVSAIPKKGAVPPLFYYMSPEQVKGEQMDIRSNLFTLGAILYEMVTDRKPFTGPDVQAVRQKIIEETPEPPATINPRINLGVSRVIMQALSKSPEERYQHGQELMLDLDRAKEPVAKPASSSAPPASGLVTPQKLSPAPSQKSVPANAAPAVMNSAGVEVSTAPKAAAAAAAASGTATAAPTPARPAANPQPAMSSAVAPAPAEKAKFAIDPMMAEDGPAARKSSSFSDLEEMPPLKEVYVAPEPPPPAVEEEPVAPPQTFSLRPRTIKSAKPERPKIVTRENAKKAISEIRAVPPQLFAYAATAAVAFILIVVVGIWLHVRHQAGDSAPAPDIQATAEQQTSAQPDASPASAPPPPAEAEPEPEVTVTPHFPQTHTKKHTRAAAPVKPISILGQITVTSVPDGAQVQIDGRTDPSWLTPYTVTGLKPGQHSISLAKSGFASESRSVDLGIGGKSEVAVHLTQLGATLVVSSQPTGASVYIDGKNAGHLTPAHVTIAERGTHTILVRKDGYLDETTTIALTPGQAFNYAPVLRAMGVTEDIKTVGKFGKLFGKKGGADMGRISVKTQPKGAQVTANHRMVEKMTPVEFLLNPGNYMVDITMPGYKPVRRVINVEEGSKVELNENLEPE